MKKGNNWLLAMKIKYPDWDAPLLAKKLPKQDLNQAPKIIDDATGEKAKVYNELSNATAQRNYVYLIFKSLQPTTDNIVAREIGITPSTVSARRNELISEGKMEVVMEGGEKAKRKDPITKTENVLWRTK